MEEAEVVKQEAAIADPVVDAEVRAVADGPDATTGDADAGDAGAATPSEGKKKRKDQGPGKKFVQDEERPVGNVKWETYKLYIDAATYTTWGWSVVVLGECGQQGWWREMLMLITVLSQVFAIGERYWLKVWGRGELPPDDRTHESKLTSKRTNTRYRHSLHSFNRPWKGIITCIRINMSCTPYLKIRP